MNTEPCQGNQPLTSTWNSLYLYSTSQSLAHDNPPVRVDSYTSGALELTTSLAFSSKLKHKSSIGVEHLDSMVVTIRDNNTPLVIDSHAKYPVEFADFDSFLAELE